MQGLTRLVLALFLLAAPALGQGDATVSADEEVPSDHVTERDRLWSNYTRENAIVGDGNLRLGLQVFWINPGSNDNEPDLTGFPFDDFEQALEIKHGVEDVEVKSVEGTRFDVMGSYGLGPTSELGFDVPVFYQSIKFEGDFPATMNTGDMGDMIVYAKWRKMLSSRASLGTGLELSLPTGSERKRLGTGDLAFNPVLNGRYAWDHVALGGHIGYNMSEGSTEDVLNYSVSTVARATAMFALRVEITGRFFRDFGENYHDVSLWPGLDVNLGEHVIIRPQTMVHLNDDAWEWGAGIGMFVDLGVGSIVDLMM